MTNGDATLPIIEFRDVGIGFDGNQVLGSVSFQLQAGEMICITGNSQSGKSVLIRLAIGFLRPDRGEVLVRGQSLNEMSEEELLSLRSEIMGMVFQENALFTGQTVYNNAAYRLIEHEWPAERVEQAVFEVLTFVGLQDDVDKQAEDLSGGMKRRLEFARALIGWPAIMLFDEPTSGLDPINARQVLDLIIRARDLYGMTSIFVTKSMNEIPYLAGHQAVRDQSGQVRLEEVDRVSQLRVMVLDEGRIVFSGTESEFQESDIEAVRNLLHPIAHEELEHFECDDPWQQNRRLNKDERG